MSLRADQRDEIRALMRNEQESGARLAVNPSAFGDYVILPSDEVRITDSATELFGRIAPTRTVFTRGNAVQVVSRINDTLRLEIVTAVAARSMFEKYARFKVYRVGRGDKVALVNGVISQDTAAAFLECRDARNLLPAVTGLLNCPVITGDGDVAGRGFHEATGLFITGGENPPELKLPAAIALLNNLVKEYTFGSLGDRSRAMASFITPALKFGGHIGGNIPADVGEANESQSGKTFRHRCVAAVYGEQPAIVAGRTGGVGSIDETLDAQLIAGRPFIQFDNFRGKFDSPHVEAFLTAEKSFLARTPFSKSIEVDPSRFLVMLTSNGVEATRDFANRSSIVRNVKRVGFKYRTFKEGDLLQHIRGNQPLYLGAVFAIVRAWIRTGRPRTEETRHDFREWAQILDWIVRNIFKEAPLMDGHLEQQVRVSNPDLSFLRNLALVVSVERLGQELTASSLYDIADGVLIKIPGLREPDERQGPRYVGLVMSRLFRSADSVTVDGITVHKTSEDRSREGGSGTFTAKSYRFERV